MANYEFLLPDTGEGLHEAEILTWLVNVGDQVKENDNIVEVQTDKAVIEISSPVSGTIEAFGAEEGETLKVGEMLVQFRDVNEKQATKQDVSELPKDETKTALSPTPDTHAETPNKKAKQRILAAPSVRKSARNADVDLTKVTPTGSNGKILAIDLENYIADQQKKTQTEDTSIISNTSKDEVVPITGLRKVIFNNMQVATSKAALCTGMDDVNVSKLVEVRKSLIPFTEKSGIKLTYLPFIIKAVSIALKNHPIFNSSINEEEMTITYRKDIHIGVAMATEEGLIVPVIHHADQKSILELAEEIDKLAAKAKNKKLSQAELTGSTFTISSTGAKGGWYATPIVNYPEVAILGVHSIKKQPIVDDDQIKIGHMMGMSITFDHRIIDGEPSGRFMNEVAELLNTPELFLLNTK